MDSRQNQVLPSIFTEGLSLKFYLIWLAHSDMTTVSSGQLNKRKTLHGSIFHIEMALILWRLNSHMVFLNLGRLEYLIGETLEQP